MSAQQKTMLANNQDTILFSFNRFKSQYAYLGLYSTFAFTPLITFKNVQGDFVNPLRLGKRQQALAFIFDTSQDFNTQVANFLA